MKKNHLFILLVTSLVAGCARKYSSELASNEPKSTVNSEESNAINKLISFINDDKNSI